MAITVKSEGLDALGELIEKMAERAPQVAAKALYEGAGVMAKEVTAGARAIRTAEFRYASVSKGETRQPSPEEKAAVEGAVGIAKFDMNGAEVQTSIGYGNAGYTEIKGKRIAVAKIANAINSGTSFMQKQPFIRKAANSGKGKAVEAMKAVLEEEYKTN